MDFGGFFLFGLLALSMALYIAYALYSALIRRKPLRSYLRGFAVLFALTVLLGG